MKQRKEKRKVMSEGGTLTSLTLKGTEAGAEKRIGEKGGSLTKPEQEQGGTD